MSSRQLANNNRKMKYTSSLKAVHAEQLIRLKQKHAQDLELLEDIRNFALQRAAIEKVYGSALAKTAQWFLSKRATALPSKSATSEPVTSNDHQYRLSVGVWKSILEETGKIGAVHLSAYDLYLHQVAEAAKVFKGRKQRAGKQALERLKAMQLHFMVSAHELEKSLKVYCEDEHEAFVCRQKASVAEEKVRTKSTGILRSMSSLEKSFAKLQARKNTQETKAASSRNRYLMDLTATNAHSNLFYGIDLRDTISMMDHGIYEFMQNVCCKMVDKQLECARVTEESFSVIAKETQQISPQYELEKMIASCAALSDIIQYDFEPQDDDQVSDLSLAYEQDVILEDEAHKWSERMKGDLKAIEDSRRVIHELWKKICEEKSKSAVANMMAKRAGTQYLLDRAKADKIKSKARLELIQLSGVEVDIPEDPPEPLEPLDELKPLLHDGGDVGESCHMDDENAAVEYELTESGDSGNNNAMPSSEIESSQFLTDVTLHYIDSDMSNDNLNGALSREVNKNVVMNMERTLQEEIDIATKAMQEDNGHVNWNVQTDNVEATKHNNVASNGSICVKQVRFSSEIMTDDDEENQASVRSSIIDEPSLNSPAKTTPIMSPLSVEIPSNFHQKTELSEASHVEYQSANSTLSDELIPASGSPSQTGNKPSDNSLRQISTPPLSSSHKDATSPLSSPSKNYTPPLSPSSKENTPPINLARKEMSPPMSPSRRDMLPAINSLYRSSPNRDRSSPLNSPSRRLEKSSSLSNNSLSNDNAANRDSKVLRSPEKSGASSPIVVQTTPRNSYISSHNNSMHLEDDDSPPPPYWRTPPLVDVNLTQYASHDSMIDTPPLPPPPPLVPDDGQSAADKACDNVSPVAIASLEDFIGEDAEAPNAIMSQTECSAENLPTEETSAGNNNCHVPHPDLLSDNNDSSHTTGDMLLPTNIREPMASEANVHDEEKQAENFNGMLPFEENVVADHSETSFDDEDQLDILESQGCRVSHDEEDSLLRPDPVLLETLLEESDECESGQTSANSTIEIRRNSADANRTSANDAPPPNSHPIENILLNEDGSTHPHETNIDDESVA